jgi:hypothetical protein
MRKHRENAPQNELFQQPANLTVSQISVSVSELRSMGIAIASWRERPPISVALLQSSYERGVQAAMADPLGW